MREQHRPSWGSPLYSRRGLVTEEVDHTEREGREKVLGGEEEVHDPAQRTLV